MKHILGLTLLMAFASADAALFSRLDGLAVYDDHLDITILIDTSLIASNTFGLPSGVNLGPYPGDTSGVDGMVGGASINWPGAMFLIDAMNAYNGVGYLGFNEWRLPATLQPDPTCSIQSNQGANFPIQGLGFGCTGSEMGHLFNVEGISVAAPGPFSGILPGSYWSSTEWAPNTLDAFAFLFDTGNQTIGFKANGRFVWAVHSGDVATIPIPAAVWLFVSALVSLGWTKRSQ